MGTTSVYLRDKLVQHIIKNITYTSPAAVYMGLFTGIPTSAGGTEVSAGGYARVQITAANWAYVGFGLDGWYVVNKTIFGPATASWGSIGYYGVWDAPTGGNFLFFGVFNSFQTINATQALVIVGGGLDVLVQFQ